MILLRALSTTSTMLSFLERRGRREFFIDGIVLNYYLVFITLGSWMDLLGWWMDFRFVLTVMPS